jgi:hypothetical protein
MKLNLAVCTALKLAFRPVGTGSALQRYHLRCAESHRILVSFEETFSLSKQSLVEVAGFIAAQAYQPLFFRRFVLFNIVSWRTVDRRVWMSRRVLAHISAPPHFMEIRSVVFLDETDGQTPSRSVGYSYIEVFVKKYFAFCFVWL